MRMGAHSGSRPRRAAGSPRSPARQGASATQPQRAPGALPTPGSSRSQAEPSSSSSSAPKWSRNIDRTPARCVARAAVSLRRPAAVSVANEPRASLAHDSRAMRPSRSRRSTRRVRPLRLRITVAARSDIRMRWPSASSRCKSTSYEVSGRPCAASSSASSAFVSVAWMRSIPRQARSSRSSSGSASAGGSERAAVCLCVAIESVPCATRPTVAAPSAPRTRSPRGRGSPYIVAHASILTPQDRPGGRAMALEGVHHITAITGDAPRNVDFYARLLGLRLVKKTVNFDAPDVYHLYFGDEIGTPGSILTFFEFPGAARGRPGAGMVHTIRWRVGSDDALAFWAGRLAEAGVDAVRDGGALRFEDFEGLRHELVAASVDDAPLAARAADIAPEHALLGFHGVRAYAQPPPRSAPLLEALGFAREADGDAEWRIGGTERQGLLTYEPPPAER